MSTGLFSLPQPPVPSSPSVVVKSVRAAVGFSASCAPSGGATRKSYHACLLSRPHRLRDHNISAAPRDRLYRAVGLYQLERAALIPVRGTRFAGIFFWGPRDLPEQRPLFLRTAVNARAAGEVQSVPLDDIPSATRAVLSSSDRALCLGCPPLAVRGGRSKRLREALPLTARGMAVCDRVQPRCAAQFPRGRRAGAAVRVPRGEGFPLSRPDPGLVSCCSLRHPAPPPPPPGEKSAGRNKKKKKHLLSARASAFPVGVRWSRSQKTAASSSRRTS